MSTNTMLSVDLATAASLPPMRTAPTVVRQKTPASGKMLIGGCLLHLPRGAWMLMDLILVCFGTALGDKLFVWWSAGNLFTDYNQWLANVVVGSAVIIAGSVVGLYEQTTLWVRSRILARCLLTVTIAMLASWLVLHLLMYSNLSRRAAASGVVFYLLTASGLRLLGHTAVREVKRGLLVIGQGPLTGTIIRSIRRGAVSGYRLVGMAVGDVQSARIESGGDIPVVGDIANIEDLCHRFDVAEVVVAEEASKNPQHQRAALACLRMGCRVTNETTFFETTFGEVPVSHISPNWFISADLKGQLQEHTTAKRLFDVAAATIGLILAAPVMLLITLILKVQGRGNALYSQTRVGQGGRPFTLYKFRTMRGDAEAGGTTWASPNDPRVTPVGRFLRITRLDELPQLWNILKGDMSLVGPRPERPEFVGPLSILIPFFNERHLIKPGLTGWAQINYSYGGSIADARRKLQLDLYYIKHTSLELDLIILLRTFGTFFRGSR
ncbi:MAG: sugar transferase [Planctomycetota bacterium]